MGRGRGGEFERLREHWYAKLRESGFQDIERPGARDPYSHFALTDSASSRLSRMDPTRFQANTEYWVLASRFLLTHEFRTDLERECFALYADGLSYRAIALVVHRNHTRVYQILKPVIGGAFHRFIRQHLSERACLDIADECEPERAEDAC